MQVHIHPMITPTSTTNSSPVVDPTTSIASLGVLLHCVLSVDENFVVDAVDAPQDSVVFVSSQPLVGHEQSRFAFLLFASNVMLHLQVESESIGGSPLSNIQFIVVFCVISTNLNPGHLSEKKT